MPADAGEDSFSLLPLLTGRSEAVRPHAVSCASSGLPSLRVGNWKLILGPGSGGWAKGGDEQPLQLYNLTEDLGETNNLAATEPTRIAEMQPLFEELISSGRSTPGRPQNNDVRVRRYPVKPPPAPTNDQK